jgi:hypothetical protein
MTDRQPYPEHQHPDDMIFQPPATFRARVRSAEGSEPAPDAGCRLSIWYLILSVMF